MHNTEKLKSIGDSGLARYTCALARFLNDNLNIDCCKTGYTTRERDLLRVAGSRKSGNDEDYVRNKFTRFNHPILSANEIRTISGVIPEVEVKFVTNIIERYMLQWNTDKKVKLFS